MRLVLFSLVNVSAALLFGMIAYLQGYGLGKVVVQVIVVLVVLQLAYVVWLVVVSMLSSNQAGPITGPRKQDLAKKSGQDVGAGAADQTGGHVS